MMETFAPSSLCTTSEGPGFLVLCPRQARSQKSAQRWKQVSVADLRGQTVSQSTGTTAECERMPPTMGAEGARAMTGDIGDLCKDESVTRQQQITSL